jgi:hypothetical protein
VTIKKTIYIIDSSSLIYLNRVHTNLIAIPQSIWNKLDEMLEEGKMTSIRCVYMEIVVDGKKPDKISEWLKSKKSLFHVPTNQQVIYMAEAVQRFSGLVDPVSEKEQADPWLVAFAREKSMQDPETEYVIVTQENPLSAIKIPAAAKAYGVRCINMREFFDENSISLEPDVAEDVTSFGVNLQPDQT